MVSVMRLYVETQFQEQAQHYAAVLASRGVAVQIETVENIA